MTQRLKGKIKVVNSKGFGFITTEAGIDYFFHYTSIDEPWKRLVATYVNNQFQIDDARSDINVEFEVDNTATEAPRAINVKLIRGVNGIN